MKRILIIQRSLTHYRKLLFEYIRKLDEYSVDVVCYGNEIKREGSLFVFPAKNIINIGKYKMYYSPGMVQYVKNHYNEYDYIILEGATNIVNNLPICHFLKKKGKCFIVWDAGRRKNAVKSFPRKIVQKPLEYVWKNAGAIIAYSTLAKQYFVSIGIPIERIFVCQNTLYVGEFDKQIRTVSQITISDIKRKYAPDGGKMILYVGAIEHRKRIKDLIDAFDKVHSEIPKSSLVIIGGGEQLEELKEYTKEKANIYLLGQIIDGVIQYFMSCDVFALPSEGGLSLNQAMICSKPLVASSADGTELDLIVNGKNGFLFEESNVEDLANKILLIIQDSDKCVKMGEYSRSIIDEHVNEREFYRHFKECLESID